MLFIVWPLTVVWKTASCWIWFFQDQNSLGFMGRRSVGWIE
ncbi:hypothetical protein LINPERHAP2_LOCUS904 [Linum perenne]